MNTIRLLKNSAYLALLFFAISGFVFEVCAQSDKKLRVICFGAHPDDGELRMAGVAAMWAKEGRAEVKFVSVTNGDIGHWREAGGPLARRRIKEVQGVSEMVGATVEVLDIHDGELMPTLVNRRTIIRLIREWDADIVMSHRPNDYHPDHRYTGVLVQDAAFMVAVPFIVPDVKPLDKNPIFLYYTDRFQKPNPSTADVVVSLDPVIDLTVDALAVMESQFLEGGALGSEDNLWNSEAEKQKKIKEMKDYFKSRYAREADKYRKELIERYGQKKGKAVKHAVAFELCEYGRQASKEELDKLFP
ncbi:MAG: PIG-L family deacetylase [Verrucomicrobia bacterium]|nr:PIG-L family deacetylase [Verrucomicrobiota bacterium]